MLETLVRHLDMVRLSLGALAITALVGCTGLITGGGDDDGPTQEQQLAEKTWLEKAKPALNTSCLGCHNGTQAGIGFLEGADDLAVRDTLLAFNPPVVNFDATASSRLLTKGAHIGPALESQQSTAILQWIQAERDGQKSDPKNQTPDVYIPAVTVQLCSAGLPDNAEGTCPTNHVSFAGLKGVDPAGIPGAEISYTAQAVGTLLYLNNLKVTGGTAGMYIEHPLFVSEPASGPAVPDAIDRYFSIKSNLKAGTTEQLSGGTAAFVGFDPAAKLSFHFKTVSAFKPDTGTVDTTGCKVIAQFKTNAQTQLNASCASCHLAGSAKAAMDLAGINTTDDTMIKAACNQVRTRINFTTTNQSGFYLAADPASQTNHPFKFNGNAGNYTTFKNSVDLWVQAEKTAP